MANDSEPRLNDLGIELRTGPVLETGGQQRWNGCTWGKEKVVTHWKHCGSQDRAQCLSARLEVALLLAQPWSWLKQLPVQPGKHWIHAVISIRGIWKLYFRHCASHNRCFGDAEVESSWKSKDTKNFLIEEIVRAFCVQSMLELPVMQQNLHLSGSNNMT